MPDKSQWYTNKDIYEMVVGLRSEMKETRSLIRQYNGLREELVDVRQELADVSGEVSDMKAKEQGRNSVGKAIREWGGWIIAVITFILLLI